MNESQFVIALVLACLLLVLYRSDQVSRSVRNLESRQSRTEGKLDALLQNAGVTYDPYANVNPHVLEAIRAGKKIEAIKRYREVSGVGLKDAKEYVERIAGR